MDSPREGWGRIHFYWVLCRVTPQTRKPHHSLIRINPKDPRKYRDYEKQAALAAMKKVRK